MIKIDLKQTLNSLLIGLLLVSGSVSANTGTSSTLKNIYEMRTLTFAILGDYYMFSGLEGDSKYSRKMQSGVKDFEQLLTMLSANEAPSSQLPQLSNALTQWKSYKDLLNTNQSDFLRQGYADGRLVDDLSKNAITLDKSLKNLYTQIGNNSKASLSEWTQHTRDMGLIIRTLTTEYTARTTSNLGQVMPMNINKGGMNQQAMIFSQLLKKLKTAPQNNPQIYKLMDQVGVKWVFIEKSVANYNENAVPFIVNSYGNRISKNLESIGQHYSEG
jgi:hypothetical protein